MTMIREILQRNYKKMAITILQRNYRKMNMIREILQRNYKKMAITILQRNYRKMTNGHFPIIPLLNCLFVRQSTYNTIQSYGRQT